MYAVHILVLGRFSPTMSVERLTLLQLGTCAVLGLAASPLLEKVYFRQTPSAWIAIGVTARPGDGAGFHHPDLGPEIHHARPGPR